MRIGINGSGRLLSGGVSGVLDDLAAAEADGFASYWVAQIGNTDALTIIGAHGETGSAMPIGTAVISTWERHPHALAAQALTTQALIGDRLIVGIGVNHQPHVEGALHQRWYKPVRHMSEYLAVLSDLLESGTADRTGEIWSYTAEGTKPSPGVPKLMIAALGDQMLNLAGRRTDGTILWCVGPKTIARHIAPTINEAAAAADRPSPSIVCSLPVWVTDDPQRARDVIATILADYAELPSYRAMLDIEGVHGLGELSLVGSEAQVLESLQTIAEAGATDFTAVPMGGNPDEIERTRAALVEAIGRF